MPAVYRTCRAVALVVALSVTWVARAKSEEPQDVLQRPNVVLIVTDDQGYGDLGCHGNPILKTPHLDRLFSESVRLTNFHVDPTCSPTRAALMTGRYSTRTGVWHTVMGRHMPRPGEVMMPSVFAESGYRTAIFGKWHLGDNYPYRPQDRGFREVFVHGGGGVGQIPDYWGNDYFDDTFLDHGRWKRQQGYCTDVFFREAIRFVAENRERPFFLYLATNAPHGPFRVADEYSRPYETLVGKDAGLAKFYGMIANIDENVGRLLAQLDDLGLAEKTIVIFMSDNGTSRGVTFAHNRGNGGEMRSGYNAGMRGKKGSPYEGGHRVPCFIRWPTGGLVGGKDLDSLSSHIDLLPTLIDLCQLQLAANVGFDGASLARLLRGEVEQMPQRTLFVHHQELPHPEKYRFGCVLRDHWRLITRNDLQPVPRLELYDVDEDPQQSVDVIDQHPEVAGQLRAAYEKWWSDLGESLNNDSHIIIGSRHQNPTHLTCFEWHGSRHWWQHEVHSAAIDNGHWAVEVAHAGEYRITLRRWPVEANLPIIAGLAGDRVIDATEAKIRIGDIEATQPIPADATAVAFQMRLPAGKTRMQTWFVASDGKAHGAYYADVERLESQ